VADRAAAAGAAVKPVRALLAALSFLTRLPVRSREQDASQLGASLVFFPVVGLGLGLLLMAGERLLRGHLSSALVAVALVSLLALLTGALHLDGLSDVFDGLGGGRRDRERTLAIMRDSRIGALGATALVLVVIAKLVAVHEVLERGALLVLCAFPVVARFAAVVLIVSFPYARAEGLGKAFHEQARGVHLVLAALLAAPVIVWTGARLAIAAGFALAVALLFAAWLNRRLGGITGDVCGAAIELSEVAFLVAVAWR
jgi:adenosylcobinamide-GDP ribazoletransferase